MIIRTEYVQYKYFRSTLYSVVPEYFAQVLPFTHQMVTSDVVSR